MNKEMKKNVKKIIQVAIDISECRISMYKLQEEKHSDSFSLGKSQRTYNRESWKSFLGENFPKRKNAIEKLRSTEAVILVLIPKHETKFFGKEFEKAEKVFQQFSGVYFPKNIESWRSMCAHHPEFSKIKLKRREK